MLSLARISKYGIGGFDPATPVALAFSFDNIPGLFSEAPRVSSITPGTAAKAVLHALKLGYACVKTR